MWECIEELPGSVKDYYKDQIFEGINETLGYLDECESPIEQLLYLGMYKHFEPIMHVIGINYMILPQFPIKLANKNYRADFMVRVQNSNGIIKEYLIECDGHDYHERTKEQAKKDKAKDRDLQKEGYIVLRFTGSEIYENPYLCAREISGVIAKQYGIDID
jgi:very-short-patch-repair endonuclease